MYSLRPLFALSCLAAVVSAGCIPNEGLSELGLTDLFFNPTIGSNTTLEARKDYPFERCAAPGISLQKVNGTIKKGKACGRGWYENRIPGSDMFIDCCKAHDECYSE